MLHAVSLGFKYLNPFFLIIIGKYANIVIFSILRKILNAVPQLENFYNSQISFFFHFFFESDILFVIVMQIFLRILPFFIFMQILVFCNKKIFMK